MNIEALISKAAGEAVKALYGMDATEKMLQLQKTRSEFRVRADMVRKASKMMFEAGMLKREVTYKELIGL